MSEGDTPNQEATSRQERRAFLEALRAIIAQSPYTWFSGKIVRADDIGAVVEVTDIATDYVKQDRLQRRANAHHVQIPDEETPEYEKLLLGTADKTQRHATVDFRSLLTHDEKGYVHDLEDRDETTAFVRDHKAEFSPGSEVRFKLALEMHPSIRSYGATNPDFERFPRSTTINIFTMMSKADFLKPTTPYPPRPRQ